MQSSNKRTKTSNVVKVGDYVTPIRDRGKDFTKGKKYKVNDVEYYEGELRWLALRCDRADEILNDPGYIGRTQYYTGEWTNWSAKDFVKCKPRKVLIR